MKKMPGLRRGSRQTSQASNYSSVRTDLFPSAVDVCLVVPSSHKFANVDFPDSCHVAKSSRSKHDIDWFLDSGGEVVSPSRRVIGSARALKDALEISTLASPTVVIRDGHEGLGRSAAGGGTAETDDQSQVAT